jgi:hypothetical protein
MIVQVHRCGTRVEVRTLLEGAEPGRSGSRRASTYRTLTFLCAYRLRRGQNRGDERSPAVRVRNGRALPNVALRHVGRHLCLLKTAERT